MQTNHTVQVVTEVETPSFASRHFKLFLYVFRRYSSLTRSCVRKYEPTAMHDERAERPLSPYWS